MVVEVVGHLEGNPRPSSSVDLEDLASDDDDDDDEVEIMMPMALAKAWARAWYE